MKKLLFVFVALFTVFGVHAQASSGDVVGYSATSIDMGRVTLGAKKEVEFKILNNGQKPVVVLDVKSDCGCTKPKWDKAPIAAGGSSVVKLVFSAESRGQFYKVMTVRHSGSKTLGKIVLRGEVV